MRFGHPTLCAPNSKQATINFNQAVRPMADGKQESGRHEKPDTNAGLIANIFQESAMRIEHQHFARAVCAQSYTGTGKPGKFGNRELTSIE
jgi:hypothetical protein